MNKAERKEYLESKEYLSGAEAAELCALQWGMEEYSENNFRGLCFRQGYKADLGEGRGAKFWKPATIQAMPKPSLNNPRRKRKKHASPAEASSSSLMLLREGAADEVGELLSPFEERRCHLGGSTVERLSYALREAALA